MSLTTVVWQRRPNDLPDQKWDETTQLFVESDRFEAAREFWDVRSLVDKQEAETEIDKHERTLRAIQIAVDQLHDSPKSLLKVLREILAHPEKKLTDIIPDGGICEDCGQPNMAHMGTSCFGFPLHHR